MSLPEIPEGKGKLVTHFVGWLDKAGITTDRMGNFSARLTLQQGDELERLVPLRDNQGMMLHVEVYEMVADDVDLSKILGS